MDEYQRARLWARSGQAARWGPQTTRRQLLNHLAKHHGYDPGTLIDQQTGNLSALHEGGHSGGYGDGVNRSVRGKEHHHIPYGPEDEAREHMLAMARLQSNQVYNDRRNPPPPRKPAGRPPAT